MGLTYTRTHTGIPRDVHTNRLRKRNGSGGTRTRVESCNVMDGKERRGKEERKNSTFKGKVERSCLILNHRVKKLRINYNNLGLLVLLEKVKIEILYKFL